MRDGDRRAEGREVHRGAEEDEISTGVASSAIRPETDALSKGFATCYRSLGFVVSDSDHLHFVTGSCFTLSASKALVVTLIYAIQPITGPNIAMAPWS